MVSISSASSPLSLQKKKKLYKNLLKLWSRDHNSDAQFWFLERGLGIASPPRFVYDFSRKMFLMCYILLAHKIWADFTAWDIA